jgi:elongation factor P
MLSISDIKKDMIIDIDGQPYKVLFSQLAKKGRAGSVLTVKLKNLLSGSVMERNFKQSDYFPEADVQESFATYLYKDETTYYFMDVKSFEQLEIAVDKVGDDALYLTDELQIGIVYHNGEPISLKIPPKVEQEIAEAPPAVKGNTVDAATKTAITETGLELQVPMFIKTGDKVRINTQTRTYDEKVK